MSEQSSRGRAWDLVRRFTLERDGWTCTYCHKPLVDGPDATADHILSKERGGTDDPSNLVAACRSCNSSKGDRDTLPRINYYNPRWFDPRLAGAITP